MSYPSETELTQVATLRHWLQIPDTETGSDADLTALITRVSGAVVRYLNRPVLVSKTVTEVRNGPGVSRRMLFTHNPVTAVSSVKINGQTIPASASYGQAGYTFDSKVLYLRGYEFYCGTQNVELAYTAGFAAGSPELLAVEQAALLICAASWKNRGLSGKQSKTMQGIGSQTVDDSEFPPTARTFLQSLRRRVPVAA